VPQVVPFDYSGVPRAAPQGEELDTE